MNGTMEVSGAMLLLQLGICAVLAWSVMCRATRMNGDTRREVRWAMAFEGVAVGLLGGAPLLPLLMPREVGWISTYFESPWPPGHTPSTFWILFLLSILLVQLVTAKYWAVGVPGHFQTPRRAGAANAVPGFSLTGGGAGL